MRVLLITQLLWLEGRLGSRKSVYHTSPKLVRNRCVIEVFGGVFVLSLCILDFFSDGVRVVVIGLSQISYFFLL